MSSPREVLGGLDALKSNYRADRLAHAYIMVGPPKTEGSPLAEDFLSFLLAGGDESADAVAAVRHRVAHRTHPDVLWVEPVSKSREIRIDQIRDLNKRIAVTSYEGGWKAAVILHAERMNENSQNALLKTLEEPPPRSLLLLLTDAPQNLRATILSRCQYVHVSSAQEAADDRWRKKTIEILRRPPDEALGDALGAAGQMDRLLKEVKAEVEEQEKKLQAGTEEDEKVLDARVEGRVREVRADLLRLVVLWRRDVLLCVMGLGAEHFHFPRHAADIEAQARPLDPPGALARLADAEAMVRRLDRHLPPLVVFEHDALAGLG